MFVTCNESVLTAFCSAKPGWSIDEYNCNDGLLFHSLMHWNGLYII